MINKIKNIQNYFISEGGWERSFILSQPIIIKCSLENLANNDFDFKLDLDNGIILW